MLDVLPERMFILEVEVQAGGEHEGLPAALELAPKPRLVCLLVRRELAGTVKHPAAVRFLTSMLPVVVPAQLPPTPGPPAPQSPPTPHRSQAVTKRGQEPTKKFKKRWSNKHKKVMSAAKGGGRGVRGCFGAEERERKGERERGAERAVNRSSVSHFPHLYTEKKVHDPSVFMIFSSRDAAVSYTSTHRKKVHDPCVFMIFDSRDAAASHTNTPLP